MEVLSDDICAMNVANGSAAGVASGVLGAVIGMIGGETGMVGAVEATIT
jgi:hypothetical protein